MPDIEATYVAYSEQDTADKLVLPYLSHTFGFPSPSSLDYQAQHTTSLQKGGTGRYDGLYLSKGFPYVILEVKKYAHDLIEQDIAQARDYCTSGIFETAVPFFVVSNGREHRFYKRSETIDAQDGQLLYGQVTGKSWKLGSVHYFV